MLLATSCRDWDPNGWAVWASSVCGLMGVAFTWRRTGMSEAVRARWVVVATLAMAALWVLWSTRTSARELLGFFYKCYYAELDLGAMVCVAFGLGFSLSALRTRDRFVRIFGGVSLVAFGCLLLLVLGRIRMIADEMW